MKARELLQRLQSLSDEELELDVEITDGFQHMCWAGDFEVKVFEDINVRIIDIGIGGCLVEDA